MAGPPSIASSDSSGGGVSLRPRADSLVVAQLNQQGGSQQMRTFPPDDKFLPREVVFSSPQMMHSEQAFAPPFGTPTQQTLTPYKAYNPQQPTTTAQKDFPRQDHDFHLPEPFPPPATLPTPQRVAAAQPAFAPNHHPHLLENEASFAQASRSFGYKDDSFKPDHKAAISVAPQVAPSRPNTSSGAKKGRRCRGANKNHHPHMNPLQMHPVHVRLPNNNFQPQLHQSQNQQTSHQQGHLVNTPQNQQIENLLPQMNQPQCQLQSKQVSQPQNEPMVLPQDQQINRLQNQKMEQVDLQSNYQAHRQQLAMHHDQQVMQIPNQQMPQAHQQQMGQIPSRQHREIVHQQPPHPAEVSLPAWHPGPIHNFSQQSLGQRVTNIDNRLRLLNQAVHMITGPSSDLAINCHNTVQEVAAMMSDTINELIREHDVSLRQRVDELDKLKSERVTINIQHTRMNRELTIANDNASFFHAQNSRLKERIANLQEESATITVEAQRFRKHHNQLVDGYKEQDQLNFAKIQDLESKLQELQLANSNNGTPGGTVSQPINSQPSNPVSDAKNMAVVKFNGSKTAPAATAEQSSRLVVSDSKQQITCGDLMPMGAGKFQKILANNNNPLFNPKAPSWEPSIASTPSPAKAALGNTARPAYATNPIGSVSSASSTSMATTGYPYRGGEPPRAPKVMRIAEAAARAASRDRAAQHGPHRPDTPSNGRASNEEAVMAPSTLVFVLRDHSVLDARYAEAFGIVCPPTVLPPFSPSGMADQTVVTYPLPSTKEVTEQMWIQARRKAIWDSHDAKAAIEHIYEVTKGYVVRCHDGAPPVTANNDLVIYDPDTWSYMIGLVSPNADHGSSHMKFLLSEPHYRPFIIERMIVDYIFTKMFSPSIFMGYSATMDDHLYALQDQLMGLGSLNLSYSDNRGRLRQRVVNDHAKLAREILEQKDINAFRRVVIDKHAVAIFHLVKSLRCVNEAATKIWTSNATMHYYFPQCGGPLCMASMNILNERQVGQNIYQLQGSSARVMFVVTPTLTLRDDNQMGYLKTFGIRKSEIIVTK
ncbi:hypothetical protein Micbo1qcDRAFT_208864 [Microdochium bolleyi]|uniref:Uncharacterized protein n=1 Tax=Microdochium bolleyi TaxID=196109 RepID=A0A136IPT2_9PEZI|nr:hypothetical protein Micbo1qcDRAFT_208864 [Microdochium bolleyi]